MDHHEAKPTTGKRSKQRYTGDQPGIGIGKSSTKKGKSKANTLDDNDEGQDDLRNVKDTKLYYRRARKQPDPEGLPDDMDESEMMNTFMTYFGLMNDKNNNDLDDICADDDGDDENDSNVDNDTHWQRRRNDYDDDNLQQEQHIQEADGDTGSSSDHINHYRQLRHQNYEDYEQDHDEENEDDEEDDDHVVDEDDGNDDDDDEDDDDDDMDDMDDMQEMERVRRKFDQQLQRMFGGTTMSEMNSQLRSILNTLKTQKDPTMQLVALQELAEILSVSNEETLSGYFACDSFVKELVRIMKGSDDLTGAGEEFPPGMEMDEDMMLALAMSGGFGGSGNPEIMLLACRCLSNLMDAMSTSVTNVVYHGATKVLCEKLKSIEYIDLAEQALTALEKIASQLPRAVINEGGLSAVLMYFDFFSIHSQRTALRTAANCMRSVDKDTVSQVMEVLPTLMNTMAYSDRTVVELSCLCWLRITENYRPNQDIIEKVVSVDLLKLVIDLIPVPGNANAARPSTFMDLLRVLRAIVKSSPSLCCELIKLNIIDIFYKVLTGSSDLPLDDDSSAAADVGLDHKWRDSVYTILKIIIDSLPPLPKDGKFSYRRFKDADRYKSRDGSVKGDDNRQDPRTVMLQNDSSLLKHITILLVPLLMEMHTSMVNIRVRQLVTHILVKLIHFSDQAELRQVLKGVPLSGFLASILTQQEHPILVTDTLYVAEMLIEKLPDIYLFLFQHEGVIHEIKSLSNKALSDKDDTTATDQSCDTNKNDDESPTNKQPKGLTDSTDTTANETGTSKAVSPSSIATSSKEETTDVKPESSNITTSTATGSTTTPTSDSISQQEEELRSMEEKLQSARRRLLNREDLPSLLRGRIGLLQQQQSQQQQQRTYVETEKGIGHGSTRRCIIQLAKAVINAYDEQMKTSTKSASQDTVSTMDVKKGDGNLIDIGTNDDESTKTGMEVLQKLSQQIQDGVANVNDAKQSLEALLAYCQGCSVGISSFELRASGLMDALLDFLTNETSDDDRCSVDGNGDATNCSLLERQDIFQSIFMPHTLESTGSDGDEIVSMIILRLQELLARFEQYQVVTPLDVTSSDSLRNPSSILSKQLRLRLTGIGANIPSDHQHLMVSTHAVATFRVIEDYLNSRIALLNGEGEDGDDDNDDEYDDANYQESTTSNENTIRQNGESVDESLEQDGLTQQDDHVANIDQSGVNEQPDAEVSTTVGNDESTAFRILDGSGTDIDQSKASTSASTTTVNGRWGIKFSVKSTVIPGDSTIYGAIHRSEMEQRKSDNLSSSIRNIWISSYPIGFERVWINDDSNEENLPSTPKELSTSTTPPVPSPSDESFSNEQICNRVLQLLKVLHFLYNKKNTIHSTSDQLALQNAFLSRKLTAKVNRQLEEPLIVASGCLPPWVFYLLREAPFLFPFETRYLFIQNTSYGYSRLISRWQSLQLRNQQHLGARGGTLDDTQQQQQLGRLERQKVRMMRNQILESAIKMLDLFATSSSSLEIEFVDEEGTGLGPTLEFYALTSKEFCKKSLGMWRDDDDTYSEPQQQQDTQDNGGDDALGVTRYVSAPHGLFPRPLINGDGTRISTDKAMQRILTLFKTLGRFVAKAMLDFRIVDIPFSVSFFNLVFGKNIPPADLVCQVDPTIGKSINFLQRFLDEKRHIYADTSLTSQEKQAAILDLQIDGISLDDLCLYFTLPGTDTNLKSDGDKIPVTIHNLSNYIDLLLDAVVGSGVSKQIEAFRSGFNDSFQIDDLKIITCNELVSLFGSSDEDWSLTTLTDTIKADHGFTMESTTLRNLLAILSEFNTKERRDFLQFTTGSPRLPIGGWKSLRPAFTVVRKIAETPLSADDYLPSVMTCANYLKMPDYSGKDMMLKRLRTAMDEGKDSFLLS